MYCPICESELEPINKEEVEQGLHDGLIYIHLNKPHTDGDIEALEYGVN